MVVSITAERHDTNNATMLIAELEANLGLRYPGMRRQRMSVDQLLAADVAFFVLHSDGAPTGCGGIHLHDTEYGETKRLYVRPQFRGHGFGNLMLTHLAEYGRARGVDLLRLETGARQTEAIGLCEQMGFVRIPPYGGYDDHPLRRFYEKRLA